MKKLILFSLLLSATIINTGSISEYVEGFEKKTSKTSRLDKRKNKRCDCQAVCAMCALTTWIAISAGGHLYYYFG